MNRQAILTLLVTGMISMGCAESLPSAEPASAATLTSADAHARPVDAPLWMADELTVKREPAKAPLWMADEFTGAAPAAPPGSQGVWAPQPAPKPTWGVPAKADLPDYL